MSNSPNQYPARTGGAKYPANITVLRQEETQAPYSQDAEEALIGAVITGGLDVYTRVAHLIRPETFYVLRYTYVWQAVESLAAANQDIDNVSLIAKLKELRHLDDGTLGVAEYGVKPYEITQLANAAGTYVHAVTYAQLIAACALRRQLLTHLDQAKGAVFDETLTAQQAYDFAFSGLLEMQNAIIKRQIVNMRGALKGYTEYLFSLEGDPLALGLPTGIGPLDAVLGRMRYGNVYSFGGTPKMGKTWVVSNIALNVAGAGVPVGFTSAEMSLNEIAERLLSIQSGIPGVTQRDPNKQGQTRTDLANAMKALLDLPLYIDPCTSVDTDQLWITGRQFARLGVKLWIIDYAQVISAPERKRFAPRSPQEIIYVTEQLKEMAVALNMVIVLPAQIHQPDKRAENKRPNVGDWFGSQIYSKVCAAMIGIYRDIVYNPATFEPGIMELILLMNRFEDKPTSYPTICKTAFNRTTGRITSNVTHVEDVNNLPFGREDDQDNGDDPVSDIPF